MAGLQEFESTWGTSVMEALKKLLDSELVLGRGNNVAEAHWRYCFLSTEISGEDLPRDLEEICSLEPQLFIVVERMTR